MSKQRILNKSARENIRILDPFTIERIKSGDWRSSPTDLLRCVHCHQHRITTPILMFYALRGEMLACYECQRKLRDKQSNLVPMSDILAVRA